VLPLSAVPRLLVRLSAAIARHDLHLGGDRQPTEQVQKERDHAIAFLKDVATGKADLGLSPAGTEPVEDAGGIRMQAGEARGLTNADLSHYQFGARG
jgi:phage gp36-like protein